MRKYIYILFFLCVLIERVDGQTTSGGNFIISAGASKNSYFHNAFRSQPVPAAVFEFPLSMEIMASQINSFGIKTSVGLINDISNSYLENNNSALKNHNTGYLLFGSANYNYYAYNEDRLLWKITIDGGYGYMDKIKFINDVKGELKGQGYIYGIGSSLRYHLGNEYGDVYPAFFELGISTERLNMNIKENTNGGKVVAATDASWQPLKFNTLNICLSFGYRFGKTKKANE